MKQRIAPIAPTWDMIEAGAQRLVGLGEDSKWPESWTPRQVKAARNEAERVWRSMWLAITELGKPADGDAAYWKAMYERERQAVFQAGRLLEGKPAEGATSLAWVIETNSTYWTGDGIMFSADHLEAIRFSRKEDAQRCLDGAVTRFLGHSNGISVTEHGWT